MKELKARLIFVYNADSGLFNTLSDIGHKIFSPQTYECNLCAITHGYFSMQQEWKTFIESLDIDLEFLHRDELQARYQRDNIALPSILLKRENQLDILINRDEINRCQQIPELKALIRDRLAAHND